MLLQNSEAMVGVRMEGCTESPGAYFNMACNLHLHAQVSIDMPAGPSEVLVVADAGANPAHVAADLLSQAEHGPDSQVRRLAYCDPLARHSLPHFTLTGTRCILALHLCVHLQVVLVALPGADVNAIEHEVSRQCDALPRNETAKRALAHSFAVKVSPVSEPRITDFLSLPLLCAGPQVSSVDQAIEFSNLYASEHLIVNVEDAERWLPRIQNAGSVFLGRCEQPLQLMKEPHSLSLLGVVWRSGGHLSL